eukprot:2383566-Alexandrium_andersonii.AAC.1
MLETMRLELEAARHQIAQHQIGQMGLKMKELGPPGPEPKLQVAYVTVDHSAPLVEGNTCVLAPTATTTAAPLAPGPVVPPAGSAGSHVWPSAGHALGGEMPKSAGRPLTIRPIAPQPPGP